MSEARRAASAKASLAPQLLGLDFSSAPSARKPLTVAWGQRMGCVVKLDRVDELPSHAELASLLAPAQPRLAQGFVVACDFPFGLPRPFVQALQRHGPPLLQSALQGTPEAAQAQEAPSGPPACERLLRALHHHCGDRAGFQRLIDAWGQAWHSDRPPGPKLLHRATDRAMPGVSSTSPLQTRYVPVGKMYFEGLRLLLDADLSLPGLREGRPDAIALEAYPGLLAHELLGRRSYKSDARASTQDEKAAQQARLIARMDLVDALEQGRSRLGLRLKLSPALRDHLVSDARGDRLDAALCLVQAAWAQREREAGHARWGLPDGVDPIEGWILTA